jgi:hypothetical protein
MPLLANKTYVLYTKPRETQSKSDYVAPYQYSGIANVGVLESENGWTINRIDFTTPGSPIIETAIGAWDDRLILIYS